PVNELLTRGGINSMLFTVSLVILALGFGGLLFVTGIVPSILAAFQEKLKKVRSIIISTAATAIGVNVLIGEQYLSIMLTGETFKGGYKGSRISRKGVSRNLGGCGTGLNPAGTLGVFRGILRGLPWVTVLYLFPFAFFCLLSPVITVLFGGRSLKKSSGNS